MTCMRGPVHENLEGCMNGMLAFLVITEVMLRFTVQSLAVHGPSNRTLGIMTDSQKPWAKRLPGHVP